MDPVIRDADTRRPIPVTERTPPGLSHGRLYLVWLPAFPGGARWDVCRWDGPRGWAHSRDEITHWLPLPPAPGGDA